MPFPDPHLDPVATLGISRVRIGIINLVVGSEVPVTAVELTEKLGISRATLSIHVAALVQAGVLHQQIDPSRRGATSGFNRLVWTANADQIDRLLNELSRYLQP